jgi:hypothetical protein
MPDTQCPFCNRQYSSYSSMRRHVRTACKIPPTAKNGGAGMQLLYARTIRRQEAEIEELRRQVGAMAEGLAKRREAGPCVTNNNTLIVHFNTFGSEDFGHITDRQVQKILLDSDSMPAAAGVLGTAMYCDPAHPENLTCHMANIREGQVMVRERSGWNVHPQSVVMSKIHESVTTVAFNQQPKNPALASAVAPILREFARAETERDYPESAYRTMLVGAKNLRRQLP